MKRYIKLLTPALFLLLPACAPPAFEVDAGLGSISSSEVTTTAPYFRHFQTVLLENGLDKKLVDDLTALLKKNEKTPAGPVYHGLTHSLRVANLTASVVSTAVAQGLSPEQKVLLVVSAMFHDVDPNRPEGSIPKVDETFIWIDKNTPSEFNEIFAELQKKNVTKDAIKTLIKFTDFHRDKKEQEKLTQAARNMAKAVPNTEFFIEWGPFLALIDKAAMYVGSEEFAEKAVRGLAKELRIEEEITLKGTAQFIDDHILNKTHFYLLPKELQDNLKNNREYFKNKWR